MPLIKVTNNLSELKDIWKSGENSYNFLLDYFQVFNVYKQLSGCIPKKIKGFAPGGLFSVLLLLPVLGCNTVNSLFLSYFQAITKAGKDSYYRFLKDDSINWRKVAYKFVKRFKALSKEDLTDKLGANNPRCFIIDDTDIPKSGKAIEGVSRVWSHLVGKHIVGYKMLCLGLWDGMSFIPLDFSYHNEKGKKKNFGLSLKERKRQYKKPREPKTNGAKRKQELRSEKPKNTLKMLRRALRNGISATYVLADSWFCSENFIRQIRSMANGALHLICACRQDKRKYSYNDGKEVKEYTAPQLRQLAKKAMKRCRKYRLHYITLRVHYKGIPLKIFFVRMSKNGKWKLFLTTDINLKFIIAFEIYKIRWAIEVFFKDCKQYLALGKNQSTDFDSQIADTTLVCIRYIMFSLYKRAHSYKSIGQLFQKDKNIFVVKHIGFQIIQFFLGLLQMIVEKLGVEMDIVKTMKKAIADDELSSVFLKIFSTLEVKGGK